MKGFGIFLMILGGIFIFFFPPFALILIVAGFIFLTVGKNSQKEKVEMYNKKQENDLAKEKELYIAKRTKELMEAKGISVLEAKAEAEMEFIIEKEGKK